MMFHYLRSAMRFIVDRYYANMRKVDMAMLWPECVHLASDLDHAKAAFAVHALNDRAWLHLGRDEVIKFIDKLQASITCPACGRTSYNWNDVKHRYCGNCHKFHDQL